MIPEQNGLLTCSLGEFLWPTNSPILAILTDHPSRCGMMWWWIKAMHCFRQTENDRTPNKGGGGVHSKMSRLKLGDDLPGTWWWQNKAIARWGCWKISKIHGWKWNIVGNGMCIWAILSLCQHFHQQLHSGRSEKGRWHRTCIMHWWWLMINYIISMSWH